jgi:hypothetical protein
MKELNLGRINYHSPYQVIDNGKGNFFFRTDYNVLYRISFSEDYTIWTEGAYEFGIYNINGKPSPNDRKLRDTIFSIIEEFFYCNPQILLYQCETGDNRQSLRDRLFLRWFNEYKFSRLYYIKVSSIIVEKQVNYAAIIVQRNNPKLDSIIQDFDNFINFFKEKPVL